MLRLVVANNSELLRHLSASPFRRMNVEVSVVSSGHEALDAVRQGDPRLVILDAEMEGLSGYEVARRIKSEHGGVRVVLVMGKRIGAEQMRRVAASGCDEILIAPMSADELYDAVALQLGLPRRGAERFAIDVAVVADDGDRSVDGRVTNLSIDGARLILPEPLGEGTRIRLTVTADDEDIEPVRVAARVAWSQSHEDATVAGAAFEEIDAAARSRLMRLTQWELVEDTERPRVVIKGDITEATNFDDLLPGLLGPVDFDLSQVGYMNSLGVRAWVQFLERAPIEGYELHACSVPFVLQASLAQNVVGRGFLASFFAPYVCERCDYEEERLLQTSAILASEERSPPEFACPSCEGGTLGLDDIPERYLAFLSAEDEGDEGGD